MAVEGARIAEKSPDQLLNAVFVTEEDGKFVGSIGLADLVRADRSKKVEELALTNCTIGAGADFADVTLMMADYNLTALAVTDNAGNLIGAISGDDLLEAPVPGDWPTRSEPDTASSNPLPHPRPLPKPP